MTPQERSERLAQLSAKHTALTEELRQSVIVSELVPTAYDSGKCSIQWRSKHPHTLSSDLRGTLTTGDGTKHSLPPNAAELLGVTPQQLWTR
jgi:hypothetical protein